MDEYKLHCRERKFIVREFTWDESTVHAGKNERDKLSAEKQKQFGPLVRWLKINFSEVFMAFVHVKALRVFVESVLRYGLPVNFCAAVLEPSKKGGKRLKEILNQHFAHLDASQMGSAIGDVPAILSLEQTSPFQRIRTEPLLSYAVPFFFKKNKKNRDMDEAEDWVQLSALANPAFATPVDPVAIGTPNLGV